MLIFLFNVVGSPFLIVLRTCKTHAVLPPGSLSAAYDNWGETTVFIYTGCELRLPEIKVRNTGFPRIKYPVLSTPCQARGRLRQAKAGSVKPGMTIKVEGLLEQCYPPSATCDYKISTSK